MQFKGEKMVKEPTVSSVHTETEWSSRPFALDDSIEWSSADVLRKSTLFEYCDPRVELEYVRYRTSINAVIITQALVAIAFLAPVRMFLGWTQPVHVIMATMLFASAARTFYHGLTRDRSNPKEAVRAAITCERNAIFVMVCGSILALEVYEHGHHCGKINLKACSNRVYPWTVLFQLGGFWILPVRARYSIPLNFLMGVNIFIGRWLTPLYDDMKVFLLKMFVQAALATFAAMVLAVTEVYHRQTFEDYVAVHQHAKIVKGLRHNTDITLESLLPPYTLKKLIEGMPVIDFARPCTVGACDVYNFVQWANSVMPASIVSTVDALVSIYDANARVFGVQKIRAVGDLYIAASGLRHPCKDHAQRMMRFAASQRTTALHLDEAVDQAVRIRVAMHTGSCTGGILGTHSLWYDVFGDGIATVRQLLHYCGPNTFLVTEATRNECPDIVVRRTEPLLLPEGRTIGTFKVISVPMPQELEDAVSFDTSLSAVPQQEELLEDATSTVDNLTQKQLEASFSTSWSHVFGTTLQKARYEYLRTRARTRLPPGLPLCEEQESEEAALPRDSVARSSGEERAGCVNNARPSLGHHGDDARNALGTPFGEAYAHHIASKLATMKSSITNLCFRDDQMEMRYRSYVTQFEIRHAIVAMMMYVGMVFVLMVTLLVEQGLTTSVATAIFIMLVATALPARRAVIESRGTAALLKGSQPEWVPVELSTATALLYVGVCATPPSLVSIDLTYLWVLTCVTLVVSTPNVGWVASFKSLASNTVIYYALSVARRPVGGAGDAVIMPTALALVGFSLFVRERKRRLNFRDITMSVAILRAAEEEASLQRNMLGMLLPSHVVETAIEMTVFGKRAVLQTTSDLCMMHVRIDGLAEHIQPYFSDPVRALEVVQSMLTTVEDVLSCGGDAVKRIRTLGDTFVVAGPLSGEDFTHCGAVQAPHTPSPPPPRDTNGCAAVPSASVASASLITARDAAARCNTIILEQEKKLKESAIAMVCILARLAKGVGFRVSAVAACGLAFSGIVGLQQPSYDVFGTVAHACTALMDAAPPGTLAVADSFRRVFDDSEGKKSGSRSDSGVRFSSPQQWRMRGVSIMRVHPVKALAPD